MGAKTSPTPCYVEGGGGAPLTTRALMKTPGFPRNRRALGDAGASGKRPGMGGSRSPEAPCMEVRVSKSIRRPDPVTTNSSRW
jgi:hypothetical protein